MLCLAILWVLIALILCLGVRSLGKVMYFLTIIPTVLLIAFLVRALTLPGAYSGLNYLFMPDFYQLLNKTVWLSAAAEVCIIVK